MRRVSDRNAKLVEDLLARYQTHAAVGREGLRQEVVSHQAFAWAARPAAVSSPAASFRRAVVWLSLLDQERDPRDMLVALRYEVDLARAAGIDVRSVLTQVAELSSTVDRFGFGSTRDILLSAC